MFYPISDVSHLCMWEKAKWDFKPNELWPDVKLQLSLITEDSFMSFHHKMKGLFVVVRSKKTKVKLLLVWQTDKQLQTRRECAKYNWICDQSSAGLVKVSGKRRLSADTPNHSTPTGSFPQACLGYEQRWDRRRSEDLSGRKPAGMQQEFWF